MAASLGDDLTVRGFYTLDLSYSDSDSAQLPTPGDPMRLEKDEFSTRGSLLGLQADYAFTNRLSFTLQALAAGQRGSGYDPRVEWAYLGYDLGDDLRVRGGRMKLSLLQGTELRYVGFSRLWVRPLVPTSGAGGFDDYDGVEFIKSVATDNYNLSFQGGFGKANHHQDFVDDHNVQILNARIERGGSWVNLALLHARYDVSLRDGRPIKDNAELYMAGVEAEIQLERWVINGGYAYGNAEVNPDERLAYLSLGYKSGKLTPYMLAAQRRMDFDGDAIRNVPPPSPPPGPPPPGRPPPGPARGAPSAPLDGRQDNNTFAIGFRYDLTASTAIKAQWDYWTDKNAANPVTGPVESHGNLFTIVFEGVF